MISEFSFKELVGFQTNEARKEEKVLQRKNKLIKGLYIYVFVGLVNKSARRILGLSLNKV